MSSRERKALGRFKNGEDFLRSAIAYLKANEFKE